MEIAPDHERDVVPALLFRVQSRLCALPITHVVETMRPLPIDPLAGAPVAVKGLARIRGVPVAVVAVADLLEINEELPTRFVTVRSGEYHVALAVGAVLGVHRISAASLRELPPLLRDTAHQAVSTIGMADTEMILVLNAARLVPEGFLASVNSRGFEQ